jgi:hypothetical protein
MKMISYVADLAKVSQSDRRHPQECPRICLWIEAGIKQGLVFKTENYIDDYARSFFLVFYYIFETYRVIFALAVTFVYSVIYLNDIQIDSV